jgi:type VI protein secretion system component Hcp
MNKRKISHLRMFTRPKVRELRQSGNGVHGSAQADERERISFSYQKIELTDLDSNTTAVDDWVSAG